MASYALGVDLGTTFSAAAIGRGSNAEPLQLGTDAAQIPSVVVLKEDGEVLVGDAADRRAALEPARAAREFKRRLGDPVPIVIGGQTQSVESLMAHMLREIVRVATEREGEAPSMVVLTHPANYSDYKRGALLEAARLAGLEPSRVQLLTEPEAAAISYSRQQQIAPGEVVAVYDFGGGTFDAALLRRSTTGFELIGLPEGMERLGGIDFDQAVMAHVDRSVGGMVSGADRNDPNTLPAQARLRVDSRRAKEALSVDSDTTIQVTVPGVNTAVRLTRDEFEAMVRPRIAETVKALERAVQSAGITMEQVSRVLLVGGSSRMPVVAEMVRSATGRPVVLDAHPKMAISTGAALAGAAAVPAAAAPTLAAPTLPPPVVGAAAGAAVGAAVGAVAPPAPADTTWQTPTRAPLPTAPVPASKGRSKAPLAIIAGLLVGALVVGAFFLLRGGKGGQSGDSTLPATTVLPTVDPGTTVPASTEVPTTVPGSTDFTTTTAAGPPLRGSDGAVDRLAFGNPPGGIPGPVLQAGVDGVVAVAFDTTGIGYVAAADGTVLRIVGQQVELFAQLPESAGVAGGIAVADDGTVFVTAEDGLWTFAGGTSNLVVPLAAAGLGAQPGPVAIDPLGNAYFADNANHRIVRRGVDGALSLVAGNGIAATPGPVDGDGQPAQNVPIGVVTAMVIDRNGRLVFNDGVLLAVRSITPDGIINTIAGGGTQPLATGPGTWADDGTAGRSLVFGGVDGLAVDGNGLLYLADDPSGAIVRLDGSGNIGVVIARNPAAQPIDGVAARQSSVGQLGAMTCNPSGGLVFTDGTSLRLIAEP